MGIIIGFLIICLLKKPPEEGKGEDDEAVLRVQKQQEPSSSSSILSPRKLYELFNNLLRPEMGKNPIPFLNKSKPHLNP